MENKYRFRDSSLSFDERVKDLLSRLTIKEKAGLMSSHMAAVPRLDIGEWYVGAEVARGYVSRNPDEPTTVFPQPIGLSGTFDTELMEKAGLAAGKEARGVPSGHPDAEAFLRQQYRKRAWNCLVRCRYEDAQRVLLCGI